MKLANTLGILPLLLLGSTATQADPGGGPADRLHRQVLVLDSHTDVLLPSTPSRYFLSDGGSRVDLPHLKAGGVGAVVMAVAVGPGPRDPQGVRAARAEADAKLAWILRFVTQNGASVGLAKSAGDVETLRRAGKIAVLISFQNARSIGKDVDQLDVFYRQGVRIFALNHAGHNDFSDSSRPIAEPVAENHGLSPLGRAAIKRLNDLGALIDVSQLSSEALAQTLALTRAPIVATHSDVRALVDNTRNLSDQELDAIKANGGVVELTPFSAYIHKVTEQDLQNATEVRARFGLSPQFKSAWDDYTTLPSDRQDAFLEAIGASQSKGTLQEYIGQIDYVVRRIGWQHVGIGSDFNHGAGVPGFDSEADAPNVTRELVRRGYTKTQIAAIWGGNFLRVLREAEAARAK